MKNNNTDLVFLFTMEYAKADFKLAMDYCVNPTICLHVPEIERDDSAIEELPLYPFVGMTLLKGSGFQETLNSVWNFNNVICVLGKSIDQIIQNICQNMVLNLSQIWKGQLCNYKGKPYYVDNILVSRKTPVYNGRFRHADYILRLKSVFPTDCDEIITWSPVREIKDISVNESDITPAKIIVQKEDNTVKFFLEIRRD